MIPGIASATMKMVIDYAYLRLCDITEENVHELFVVSDYVAMMGLVKLCVEFMSNMLRPDNCVGLMRFARFVKWK